MDKKSSTLSEAASGAQSDEHGDDSMLDTTVSDGEDCDDMDDGDEPGSNDNGLEPPTKRKKTKGRVKIKMEFISNKLRRYTTFSKRKTGIMKKAYELSTLTGTQIMLLVASETGHVYTFATPKLQPMITSESGKALIQTCLNTPDPAADETERKNRMVSTGYEETELTYPAEIDDDGKEMSPTQEGFEDRTAMATGINRPSLHAASSQQPADMRRDAQAFASTATILPRPIATTATSPPPDISHASRSGTARPVSSEGARGSGIATGYQQQSGRPGALAPSNAPVPTSQYHPQRNIPNTSQRNVLIATSGVPQVDAMNTPRAMLLPRQGQAFSSARPDDSQQSQPVYRQP